MAPLTSDFQFSNRPHPPCARQRTRRGRDQRVHRNPVIPIAELPGISVFYKDPATEHVYHTYSTYARGIDMLNVAYHYLDVVPKGRDEEGRADRWIRRRDEYADTKAASCH